MPTKGSGGTNDKEISSARLPGGCILRVLETHDDTRGALTEIFRNSWIEGERPASWRLVRPSPQTPPAVQAQRQAPRFLCLLRGQVWIGLHDLRPEPKNRRSATLHLAAAPHHVLVVPPRVACGLYFPDGGCYLNGTTMPPDEPMHCRWQAPELGFAFSGLDPRQADADGGALDYASFAAALAD